MDLPQAPFNEAEKRFVVAEVLKQSNIPLQKFLQILQDGKIGDPEWSAILVPHGRNLRSCIDMYDDLLATYSNDPSAEPTIPNKRSIELSNIDDPADSARKRRQSGHEKVAIAARAIQPKPAANGSPIPSLPTGTPTGKKRGRPSKKDLEVRAATEAEAVARGEQLPELKPKGVRKSAGEQAAAAPAAPMFSKFEGPQPGQSATPSATPPLEGGDEMGYAGKKKRARPSSSKSKVSPAGPGTFDVPMEQAPGFSPQPEGNTVAEGSGPDAITTLDEVPPLIQTTSGLESAETIKSETLRSEI